MAAKDLRPDPAGRRQGGGPGLRRPSSRRSIRLGVVAFGDSGVDHAAAHRRPRRGARRHRPADARRAAPRSAAASSPRSAPSPASRSASTRPASDGSREATTSATTARPPWSCCPTARTPPSPTRSELAELASTAGVQIYPIGLGSPQGTVLEVDGFQVSTALDEATLQADRRRPPTAPTTPPATRPRWPRSTARSTSPGRPAPSTREVTSWFAAGAAAAPAARGRAVGRCARGG